MRSMQPARKHDVEQLERYWRREKRLGTLTEVIRSVVDEGLEEHEPHWSVALSSEMEMAHSRSLPRNLVEEHEGPAYNLYGWIGQPFRSERTLEEWRKKRVRPSIAIAELRI
jgi:hypothetical protein